MSITNRIKGTFAALGMVLFAANVAATPILTFDGSMNYDTETGAFSVTGGLTGALETTTSPVLPGSAFELSGIFASTISSAGVTSLSFTDSTLVVTGGDATALLNGGLTGLQMSGGDGLTFGILAGIFNATSGSMLSDFSGNSDLFALELNVSTPFSSEMFKTNFTGLVDGNIHSQGLVTVPEPGILALFIMGLGLLLIAVWQTPRQKFSMQVR